MNTPFNIPGKICISTGLPEKMSPGWFISHRVFLLSFVSLIKPKRGDRPYIFTVMKPLKPFFLSMVTIFYIFASFKQIWITKYTDFVKATIESGRGGGQKIVRVEMNYSSGIREDKLSPDRQNWATGRGFTGSLTERQMMFAMFVSLVSFL